MTRSALRRGFVLIALAFACFALSPQTRATCRDGCDTTHFNTFLGDDALASNLLGGANTAIGSKALYSNIGGFLDGGGNTAIGASALYSNTHGKDNTATGYQALQNSTANYNTATGYQALSQNTTGTGNTATGYQALLLNSTANYNTATGYQALIENTTGAGSVATGYQALSKNTTGLNNTADGFEALNINTTGSANTAIGNLALALNTTGANNIAIGYQAGFRLTTGSDNIDIGDDGNFGESSTIRIGSGQTNTYIAGIYGTALASGSTVRVDSAGHLGTVASSARFKKEIKPMDKASETILALHPVTFRYKEEIDANGIPQFGLVAEEVEKVDPALVERDQEGKPYSVRYEAVNAMLLNEFLKEYRKNERQESSIAEQRKEIEELKATLKEQAAQIQKVSAELATERVRPIGGLEMSKSALLQTVANNQ